MVNKPINVLFIEDNPGDVRLIREMLAEADGGRVKMEGADRLSTGLERLAEGGIDCILLDLTLPDCTELETLAQVQAQAPAIAIIIISGLSDETLAIEAVRNGAQDYLVKDHLGSYALARSIRYAIERKRMEEELERYREHLEELVKERTDELLLANRALQKEIAERKRTGEELRETADYLDSLMSHASAPIIVWDPELRITRFNHAFELLSGYKADEVIGQKLHILFREASRDKLLSKIELTLSGEYWRSVEIPILRKDGDIRVILWNSANIRTNDGSLPVATIAQGIDITERIRDAEKLKEAYAHLERQSAILAQQAKMSAIGVLVAGVAHELNNPLMAMLHFAQYCLKHIAEDDRSYTVLQDIEHEAMRCIDIVKNLLTFSHSGDGRKERYELKNPAEILERVVTLLSYRIEKEGVSVTSHVDKETPNIRMRVNAMQDVILNLLTNALDALEESEKKELNIDIHPEDDGILVSVADSGIGISPETLNNIYDPFFTTKPVGRGTGLGLSLCQGIIHAQGGEIRCESEPGKGTVFHVSIPLKRRKGVQRDETHFSD
jgi:PAS domain S-box-containing protein